MIDFDLLDTAPPRLDVAAADRRHRRAPRRRRRGHQAAHVTLLNLDDLRDWAGRALALRAEEADRVNDIVVEEVERFDLEATARQAAPLVAQLHQNAEAIRRAEIERFTARLASLDDAQRAAVEAVTKGIVAKLLHKPSVKLKDDAGTPQGERNAAAVRDLFDLG